ncbi:hypothetical protein ASH00_15820 [Arthrobacter sp. Soil782]|uniref:hypothetical protein n=1 Tax=Arthrobacter sp. Soil782 TaxID=1736410 RepID=UPI0006F3AA03|nr:hypothetical protein [Arthrobacter sp. Soil782]KRF03252.1 hypothetical protein ASH00_15820 [Arthrobacter sp. Soil782]
MSDLKTLTTVPNLTVAANPRSLRLTEILLSLTDPGAEARIAVTETADRLRDPYLVNHAGPPSMVGVAASMLGFASDLADILPSARIDYWLELAQYAVQVEMKHLPDDFYVYRAEPHEVLVDLTDYLDTDSERLEANEYNAERWAELADIATFHAFAEGALALPQAA